MTSAPIRPSPPAVPEGAEARWLIDQLTQVLDDRMTPAVHPYALVLQEHLGTCRHNQCSARCREYRALFVQAVAWLEAHKEPEQLPLLEAVS